MCWWFHTWSGRSKLDDLTIKPRGYIKEKLFPWSRNSLLTVFLKPNVHYNWSIFLYNEVCPLIEQFWFNRFHDGVCNILYIVYTIFVLSCNERFVAYWRIILASWNKPVERKEKKVSCSKKYWMATYGVQTRARLAILLFLVRGTKHLSNLHHLHVDISIPYKF